MKDLQLPTTVKTIAPEPQGAYPSILPSWFRNETGMLDYEAQDASRQIKPVTDGGRVALDFEIAPTDGSPNWGASGHRVEIWPPKDGASDRKGTVCMSWVFPDPTVFNGVGYAWPFQYHVGTDAKDPDWVTDNQGGLMTGLSVLDGVVRVYTRLEPYRTVGTLKAGEALFAQLSYDYTGTGGAFKWWVSFGAPPADSAAPLQSSTETYAGSNPYPKTGMYVRDVQKTIRFRQTSFARRATVAEARAAAGWTAAPPPPPPPPPPTDSLPIREVPGSRTATKVTLAWDPIPCLGYVLYANGVRKSNTWDPTKSTWRTDIANEIKIIAYGEKASGTWRP